MTYLDWGCDPLRDECSACLDAICTACFEGFRRRASDTNVRDGLEESCPDTEEPDCDHCELEKKPDCSRCMAAIAACRACSRHADCEYRL